MPNQEKLKFFPVAAFSLIMGLVGFAMALKAAEKQGIVPIEASPLIYFLSVAVFALISLIYLMKIVRHGDQVLAEFNHPIKLQFFPAISISLVLIGTASYGQQHAAAGLVWSLGSSMHLVFTLIIINEWLHRSSFEIIHSNPSWFIPVVGNILIPVGGVAMAPAEISWFFFSIGLVFWIVLFTIIFYRMVFHPPMPGKLLPTLAIFLAPPAVGFLAYVALNGGLDHFARILYYTALFITLLLLMQVGRLAKLQFTLSMWAYSFPLAAMTIASIKMLELTGIKIFSLISHALLMILILVIAGLIVRTIIAVQRHEICVEE